MGILDELNTYDRQVELHDGQFRQVRDIWARVMAHSAQQPRRPADLLRRPAETAGSGLVHGV
jgi:methylmalonyl-CoA mutase N-terminal domain/subunit